MASVYEVRVKALMQVAFEIKKELDNSETPEPQKKLQLADVYKKIADEHFEAGKRSAIEQERQELFNKAADFGDRSKVLRGQRAGTGPMQVGQGTEEPEKRLAPMPSSEYLTFDDVIGMDKLKELVTYRLIAPITEVKISNKWKQAPGGKFLLYGPPGCGKTYFTRAIAGELSKKIDPLNMYSIKLSDVLSKWYGETPVRIANIFKDAKEVAGKKGLSIVFIDEAEAFLRPRDSQGSDSPDEKAVAQMLTEISAIRKTDRLLILYATNIPWNIDMALLRQGRIDRTFLIGAPDNDAKTGILKYHLNGYPVETGLNYADLAEKAELFSAGDLEGACQRAIYEAYVRELKTKDASIKVTSEQLESMLSEIALKTSIRPWLIRSKEMLDNNSMARQYFSEVLVEVRKYLGESADYADTKASDDLEGWIGGEQ